jgi:hypothetical protein
MRMQVPTVWRRRKSWDGPISTVSRSRTIRSRQNFGRSRCDLTKDQRDQHIRRYAELLEAKAKRIVPQDAEQIPAARGRPKSITTQVAEATGLSDDTVRRALNPKPAPRPQLVEVKDTYDVVAQDGDVYERED